MTPAINNPPSPDVATLLSVAAAAASVGERSKAAAAWAEALDAAQRTGAPVPKSTHFDLARTLFELGRLDDAQARAEQGTARDARDFALTNLLGVIYKNQRRYAQALDALAKAEKLNPRSLSPLVNRANVYLAMADGRRAAEVLRKLIRLAPKDAEHLRLLGNALRLSGDLDGALKQFELARRLDARSDKAWIDSVALLREAGRYEDALTMVERGLAAAMDKTRLLITKVQVLRAAGRLAEIESFLKPLLRPEPAAAWAYHQLARTIAPYDRHRANPLYQEAARLRPDQPEYAEDLIDSFDRTRGPEEPAFVHKAYVLARQFLQRGGDLRAHSTVLSNVLERSADYAAAESLGTFEALGRYWVDTGATSALHYHMARVRTPADRRTLVELHRRHGRRLDDAARVTPLRRVPAAGGRAKIRVGIMSSDLRSHPVSYFALPLLEGYDRERFEFHCYSWSSQPPDAVQNHIANIVDRFHCRPELSARDAAQLIADDQVDILFELGGTTNMNKLEVMTWRPAPIQVSWLGYPHSAGPESIDYLLVDPFLKPADPALMIEKPFELAHSWVALGALGFNDEVAVEPGLPQERAGHLTFGTMNNPYKYRPATLATWAEIVRRTPGSRFLFVRPEGGAAGFRENIWRAFEAGGVERSRVEFMPVRGAHLQHYNRIDIALDTFPQTGGTTTCECLWMGVPVVTLVGEAFFERLSYSNLSNAGLGDLCAFDREAYMATALALPIDSDRRRALRHGLRAQLRRQPIGRTELFVSDFQQAVERVVQEHRA
jgi:protein O-GlcNAc transferase